MEKKATEEAVWFVCRDLEADNQTISATSVLNVLGGSKSTVLPHISTYHSKGRKSLSGFSEIPSDVQNIIARALSLNTQFTTATLTAERDEANARENEAVEALAQNENQIVALQTELRTTQSELDEERRLKERQAAVDAETIVGLREQCVTLKQDINRLNLEGEASRTGLQISQLKLEYCERSTEKALNEIQELQSQLNEATSSKIHLEKELAVTACSTRNMQDQIGTLEKMLEETGIKTKNLESEKTGLTRQLNNLTLLHCKAENIIEQLTTQIYNYTIMTGQGQPTKLLDHNISGPIVQTQEHLGRANTESTNSACVHTCPVANKNTAPSPAELIKRQDNSQNIGVRRANILGAVPSVVRAVAKTAISVRVAKTHAQNIPKPLAGLNDDRAIDQISVLEPEVVNLSSNGGTDDPPENLADDVGEQIYSQSDENIGDQKVQTDLEAAVDTITLEEA